MERREKKMDLTADVNAKKLACIAGNRLKRPLDDAIENDERSPSPTPVATDIVDTTEQETDNSINELPGLDIHNSWIMQMSGLTAYISTVNYVGDDLYVGVLQNTIVFPSCIGELNDQAKSTEFFNGLFQFRNNMEKFAQAVKSCILRENKTNTNINTRYHHSGYTTPPNSHHPSSQTWYTPPRKQQKRSVSPTANYELLNTGQYVVVGDDDIVVSPLDDDDNENAQVDEFGLVKLDNGWYHLRLKKHFDQHPGRLIDC